MIVTNDYVVCMYFSFNKKNIRLQINLCQKVLFLHQLTHNMTTNCSLNYEFTGVNICLYSPRFLGEQTQRIKRFREGFWWYGAKFQKYLIFQN